MANLPAAAYRQVITLQVLTQAPDDYGQQVCTWVNVGDFRAFVFSPGEHGKGREKLLAGQVKAQLYRIVQIRYLGASIPVKADTNRVIFQGKVLNIIYLFNVDETNQQYEIHCLEDDSATP